MYIPEKSNKQLEIRINPVRVNIGFIFGGLIAFIGFAMMIFTAVVMEEMGMALLSLLLVELGTSFIINGVTLKAVKLIVYDEGIYGVSAKINPICGFLNKTLPFDILYHEIIGMRYEGEFLIQTKNNDYSFSFTKEEAYQIMELVKDKIVV